MMRIVTPRKGAARVGDAESYLKRLIRSVELRDLCDILRARQIRTVGPLRTRRDRSCPCIDGGSAHLAVRHRVRRYRVPARPRRLVDGSLTSRPSPRSVVEARFRYRRTRSSRVPFTAGQSALLLLPAVSVTRMRAVVRSKSDLVRLDRCVLGSLG